MAWKQYWLKGLKIDIYMNDRFPGLSFYKIILKNKIYIEKRSTETFTTLAALQNCKL